MNAKARSAETAMRNIGYMTLREVAEAVGVDHSTVARWARDGKVERAVIGGRVYVHRDSLAEFLGDDVAGELGLS